MLLGLAGTGIRSLTILLVAAIVVMAGFRPAMRMLLSNSGPALENAGNMAALESPMASITGSGAAPLDMPEMASPAAGANPFSGGMGADSDFGTGLSFGRSLALGPVEKLGAIIDRDEEQATAIMKHWVKNG